MCEVWIASSTCSQFAGASTELADMKLYEGGLLSTPSHRQPVRPAAALRPDAAAIIIAEIGLDLSRFPTPAHLASWAKFAPGIHSSAGKIKGKGSTGHGNRHLARIL